MTISNDFGHNELHNSPAQKQVSIFSFVCVREK